MTTVLEIVETNNRIWSVLFRLYCLDCVRSLLDIIPFTRGRCICLPKGRAFSHLANFYLTN